MPAVVLQPRSCGATLSNYLRHVYPRRSVVACNYVAASSVALKNRLSTYSSASRPSDFFIRCACFRKSASFDGSTVVVMRTRLGRFSRGRPNAALGSLWGSDEINCSRSIGRYLTSAVIEYFSQCHSAFCQYLTRSLCYRRLHVDSHFASDCRAANPRTCF